MLKASTLKMIGASKVNKHWSANTRKVIAKDYRANRSTARTRILSRGTGV